MVSSISKVLLVVSLALKTHAFTSPSQPHHISTSTLNRVGKTTTDDSLTKCYQSKDADMTDTEREEAMEKALKAMTAFSNKYTVNTNTKYCSDKSIPAVVIKGLAEHKVTLGTPLCPCRFYEDKEKEAKEGYWNCPCAPMRERHECHCMLFLTEENDFAGDDQTISYEEVKERCGGCEGL